MNRGVYTAATGMMAQQRRLEIVANNLANVNVNGYKADRVTFGETMRRAMAADGGTGENVGGLSSGASIRVEDVDFTDGGLETTGNPLNVAIRGEGMFAVQTASGVRYTRDGSFSTNGAKGLVTQDGNAVLDTNGKPITLPDGPVEIDAKGAIHPVGKSSETVATIGISKGTFTKEGLNLYSAPNATATTATVLSGHLETANVEPVSQMVEMISLQRAFETAQKMVQSQDEATGKLSETMGS